MERVADFNRFRKMRQKYMDFENKQDLIDFVREQLGVVLENDETHPLNQHPDLLYT